ncbi:alpha/beta fold hydrolase [Kordiimonas lacus]|uniref:Polyhydroxyalkanoate synthase n=1 Tax=Kordiimonas lacus TaxID=637679 RepID=A0A1G6XPJ4_9PROT|nr:alpha/beta fold hydrolase [Kordiimonas lacus]SDD80098.1 polyhydroxyalkanoate synthase [Kordiimonas lacus]
MTAEPQDTARPWGEIEAQIRGPRPMSLHLANSLMIWREAGAGVRRLRAGTGMWHLGVRDSLEALKGLMRTEEDWQRLYAAVEKKASGRADTMLRGIAKYIAHPYKRPESAAALALKIGSCRLYDFGGSGKPILMVPSLINPHYVLDLKPGRSLAAFLKERGYRPYLVHWYDPGEEELRFGIGDFVMKRLKPFLEHVAGVAGEAVPVLGYCMGGTLTTALAARAGDMVSKLALVAAPWDFDTKKPHAGKKYAPVMAEALAKLPTGMPLPVDAVQTFFTSVDPTLNDRKFRKFEAMDPSSEAAEFFVALETWANTGAPLPRKVAEETMLGWYRDNTPGRGAWYVGDAPVRLEDITCPVWIAAPEEDRLVPQESAYAMLDGLPNAVAHDPGAGHVGMMVGSKARTGLWEPLLKWLEDDHAA